MFWSLIVWACSQLGRAHWVSVIIKRLYLTNRRSGSPPLGYYNRGIKNESE
jgi:hypothetical protein